MVSFWEEVKVDEGSMGIYTSIPQRPGFYPGIIVIQHQGGVDEPMQGMARRIAGAGYLAAAPELYHRDGPHCRDDGPTRRARLRDDNIIKDVGAAVDFLRHHPSVAGQKIGIIGFCMGGRVAYLMAAANPHLDAAVSYYGGNIFLSWGDGPAPFDRTAEIRCPILCHFGEEDQNPSPEDMKRLDAELTKHGKLYELYSYPDAGHAFMNKRSPSYRAHADEASWPRTLDFFARHLAQPERKKAASL